MSEAKTVICYSQEELDAALKNLISEGGGEILLAPKAEFQIIAWDKDESNVNPDIAFKSLNPDDPAIVTAVHMKGIENISFENLKIQDPGSDSLHPTSVIDLMSCRNFTFRNNIMEGSAEGAPGTVDNYKAASSAAVVKWSDGVVFEQNEISNFYHGLAFRDCADVDVIRNDINGLQGDGIRIGGVSRMNVQENHLHDMMGSTTEFNHPDFIQLWGFRTTVSNENISITDNILDASGGPRYQLIFGHNQNVEDGNKVFENVLIEGNLLFGGHRHAISIDDTNNATVRNNTVINSADTFVIEADGSTTPSSMVGMIEIGGTNAIVENNVAHIVRNEGDNVILGIGDDPSDDYRDHFLNVEAGGSGDLRDLMLRPDSPLNGVAGSHLTWFDPTADALLAVADVTVSKFDQSEVTLTAEHSRSATGLAVDAGADFTWIFADGTEKKGVTVTHDFGTSGSHDYILVVTLPDGTKDQITRSIDIDSPYVFDLDVSGSILSDKTEIANDIALKGDLVVADDWVEIGGQSRIEIPRSNDALFNLSSFNLGITIDREDGMAGSFLDLPHSLSARIDAEGHVWFTMNTDAGEFKLVSGVAIFADEAAHHLNFVYDGDQGSLALLVDGELTDTVEAHGTTNPKMYWGLTVGNTWNDGLSAKVRDIYLLRENLERDGSAIKDISADAMPSFLGYLFWDANGVEAVDLDYTLSGVGPWTPAGINISENSLALTRQNDVFYEADAFSVEFTLQMNDPDSSGTIAYLHNTLDLALNDSGQLVLRLKTSEGWEQIASGPENWDTESHKISIQYDSAENSLQLFVDDRLVASGEHSGTTASVKYWGLNFGHPWGGETVDALVNYITVSDTPSLHDGPYVIDGLFDPTAHGLSGETVLAFDFEGSKLADLSGAGAQLQSADGNFVFSEVLGSQVLDVSSDKAALEVTRGYEDLYGQDDFVFSLDMKSDTSDGRNVFGIHKAFQLDVVDDDLVFRMTTSEGQFEVSTDGDVLADRDWHEVQIAYSDSLGQLQISVDGSLVDSEDASGTTPDVQHWGLSVGRKWGNGFDGQIDDFIFMTDVGGDHFSIV
jgi:hypothetical protein